MQLTQPSVLNQTATPGTAQSGNENLSGTIIAGGTVQGATVNGTSKFQLNGISILEEGSTFPASPSNLQRYKHDTYRSWFVYNSTDAKWRQESPGVFDGSFPTVSSGDNTVAPQIEVKRKDRNNEVYFWNGANWLSVADYPVFLSAKLGVAASTTLSASTTAANQGVHPDGSSDVYITNITTLLFPSGTNNGSNYWIAQFRIRALNATISNTYTGNTSAGTSGTLVQISIAVNAVVTRTNFSDVLQDVNKSGAPGNVDFFPSILHARLVG